MYYDLAYDFFFISVQQSSNELLEIASTEQVQYNTHHQVNVSPSVSPAHYSRKSKKTIEIERVINLVNQGYKVLILMRGLPGSGKSSLSKYILENTIGYNNTYDKHILSTDDFFTKNGVYQYNKSQLPEAHGYNHQRAFSVMCKGFSPVIIDNTNTQMWEMKPYAMMATDYGYILEILEPDTHWCFNEKELEKRNKHGVSKVVIKNMLDRYEKNVTPMKLLTAYDCKYKLQQPPQYRLHPPLPQPTAQFNGVLKSRSENQQQKLEKSPRTFSCVSQESTKETINFMDFFEPTNSRSATASKKLGANPFDSKTAQSSSVDDILMHSDPSFLKAPVLKPVHTTKIKQSSSLFDNINAWGVDAMALQSWDIVTPLKENEAEHLESSIIIDDDEDDKVETQEMSTSTDDNDFFIVRNILSFPPPKTVKVINTCNRDINRNTPMRPHNIKQKLMIDKSSLTEDFLDDHKMNLDNLARVFPNVSRNIVKYWYEKCNRDFDCTIELLLAEKEEIINVIIDDDSDKETDIAEPIVIDSDSSSSSTSENLATPTKHKRKNNSSSSDESQDLKKYIESKVTISNNHYSEKLLKIKQWRYGEASPGKAYSEQESPIMLSSPAELEPETENKLYFDDLDWEDPPSKMDQVDNVETIELNLGDHFVKQLEDNFADPNLQYPKGFQPVVQMPVALARQLYTFYIESVYQQMEVQNSVMDALVKEDEEFARNLQEKEEKALNILPNETKTRTEPTEIPDIIKEQRELSRWQREADKWKQDTPDTVAARLTREKLFNSFPSLDRDTLVEILHAHENVYKDTVETLLASTNIENVHGDMKTIKEPPINAVTVKEMWEAHESCEKHDVSTYCNSR